MKIEGLSMIYKITNPCGKIYIGQSVDWVKRMREYKNTSSDTQKLIMRSIKKYGWESHKIELLGYFPLEIINQIEIDFIQLYNSYYKNNEKGLNMTIGGEAPMAGKFGKDHSAFGRKISEETRKKMSDAQKKVIRNPEWAKKAGETRKGSKSSKESIEKRIAKTSVPIIRYSLEGEFIDIWKSIADAGRFLNTRCSNIIRNIKNDEDYNHVKNFQFRYWTENYPLKIERTKCKNYSRIKVINLITLEEEIVIGFKLLKEKFNLSMDTIHDALTTRKGLMKKKGLKIEILKD